MQLSKTFRLANGDRAVIDLRLEHVSSARGTVRHGESLPYGYVRVSISGELTTKGMPFGTNASSYGQVIREDMPSNLRGVWSRWHLNDLRPGCEHQGPDAQLGDTCPEGYGYGTAWLVNPLTVAGAQELLATFDTPVDAVIIARDGIVVDIVRSQDVLRRMHSLVPYSVLHAVTYEGWEIEHPNGQPVFDRERVLA